MNLVSIAWKSVRQRALASWLTALSVALGVTLMVAVLVINGVVDRLFNQSATTYHLVVGAKGSPLQLVLNTVYHLSTPVENIPYTYYKRLKNDPRLEEVIPIAAGDSTQEGGFRIVGTIPHFFDLEYVPGREFLVRGNFLRGDWDAVIGSQVARQNGWGLGHEFQPVHGVGESDHHHEEKFKVVGILAPTGTPNDKVVFIHLDGFYQIAGHEKPAEEASARAESFSAVEKAGRVKAAAAPVEKKAPGDGLAPPAKKAAAHDHHDHAGHHHHELPDEQKEVTALLVRAKHVTLAIRMKTEINEGPYAQAANPAEQIGWLMSNVLGNVRMLLVILTGLIIVVSGVSIFVSIYNTMADRRREIAVMRALGARRTTVFALILTESVLLCVGGGLLGLLLGHGLVLAAGPFVELRSGILIDPFAFEPIELVLLPVLILLAAAIGVVPGMTAYRTDVGRTLAS
jgi:putative ABC transport system permease protein